ncbi:DinB family protein [Myroides sp. DW712]|uniref:DinB family protein n=1 Tax=Myroides sp. DW712 TaxID=3389800 RepID=UPI00397A4E14
MNQQEIKEQLELKYQSFVRHVEQMTEEEYQYHPVGKWNAAQHLHHLVLCVQPLVYVYMQPIKTVEERFGRVERLNKTYEELTEIYLGKLAAGGKAPEQFVPPADDSSSKEVLTQQLLALIGKLNEAIVQMEVNDFESVQIPHPLLGLITLKEMAYNAIYHVEHHQKALIKG